MSAIETEVERLNPVRGGRWFSLPITAAIGDDGWCACIVCGLPRDGTNPVTNAHLGKPVEYLVRIRTNGETTWRGLHAQCWQRNPGSEETAELVRKWEKENDPER